MRNGGKRGENIIRVFDYNGMKLAHFGDLGHLLDAETAKEIGNIDVALLPVGGFYTIDAKTAKAVAAKCKCQGGYTYALPWTGLWLPGYRNGGGIHRFVR